MTIETVTYIDDLDPTYPLYNDEKKEGDDHIRNVKKAIKNTFTGIDAPVTVTETELNRLAGVTSGVQSQINELDSRIDAIDDSMGDDFADKVNALMYRYDPTLFTTPYSNIMQDASGVYKGCISWNAGGLQAQPVFTTITWDYIYTPELHVSQGSSESTTLGSVDIGETYGIKSSRIGIKGTTITGSDIDLTLSNSVLINNNTLGGQIIAHPILPGIVTFIVYNNTGVTGSVVVATNRKCFGDYSAMNDLGITLGGTANSAFYIAGVPNKTCGWLVLFFTGYYYCFIGGGYLDDDSNSAAIVSTGYNFS